jgi:hypothetical protein
MNTYLPTAPTSRRRGQRASSNAKFQRRPNTDAEYFEVACTNPLVELVAFVGAGTTLAETNTLVDFVMQTTPPASYM